MLRRLRVCWERPRGERIATDGRGGYGARMGRIARLVRKIAGGEPAAARAGLAGASAAAGGPGPSLEHYPRPPRVHPTKWGWPAYLDSGRPWLQSLRELYATPLSFPDSISPEAGLLVHALVRNIQPRVVVEVGAFAGISAHWIAGALLEFAEGQPADLSAAPRLHVFDLFDPIRKGPWREAELLEDRAEWILGRLRRAGLDHLVMLHRGDSGTMISRMRAELEAAGGVQLAFIDGDHTPAGVLRDFRAIEPVLNTGGYVLLHDTIPAQCTHAGPRKLLDTIDEVGAGRYERMDLYSAPLNYGLGLLRRIG